LTKVCDHVCTGEEKGPLVTLDSHEAPNGAWLTVRMTHAVSRHEWSHCASQRMEMNVPDFLDICQDRRIEARNVDPLGHSMLLRDMSDLLANVDFDSDRSGRRCLDELLTDAESDHTRRVRPRWSLPLALGTVEALSRVVTKIVSVLR